MTKTNRIGDTTVLFFVKTERADYAFTRRVKDSKIITLDWVLSQVTHPYLTVRARWYTGLGHPNELHHENKIMPELPQGEGHSAVSLPDGQGVPGLPELPGLQDQVPAEHGPGEENPGGSLPGR